jgi:hypothetical protein
MRLSFRGHQKNIFEHELQKNRPKKLLLLMKQKAQAISLKPIKTSTLPHPLTNFPLKPPCKLLNLIRTNKNIFFIHGIFKIIVDNNQIILACQFLF